MVAQAPEKEVVATISGKALSGGLVTGLAWDGGTLIIQVAVVEKGEAKARYFAVPGRGMELKALDAVPVTVESLLEDARPAASSPTGLGTITLVSGSKLPMYGVASQEKRFADAMDMGGTQVSHEVRIGELVINRRRDTAPYDGEVWSWSPAEVNRVAYVDEKGDLGWRGRTGAAPSACWPAATPCPPGPTTAASSPSPSGRATAASGRSAVVHLPERFRQ